MANVALAEGTEMKPLGVAVPGISPRRIDEGSRIRSGLTSSLDRISRDGMVAAAGLVMIVDDSSLPLDAVTGALARIAAAALEA